MAGLIPRLTKRSDGVFVPQVSPLDRGEVGVAEVGRIGSAVSAVGSEGWNVPPPWVARKTGQGGEGRWVQQSVPKLTWTHSSVDWLAGVVETDF